MKVIDVKGMPCPIPVVEAKKELMIDGATGVIVLVDNTVAVQNLEKLANSLGCKFSCSERDGSTFEIIIETKGKITEVAELSTIVRKNNWIVIIGRDSMGEGTIELGKILIKGFLYSLTELENPPSHIIFLNSGVKMTASGSNTIADIMALEEKGTTILTCGTCSNYYNLYDDLAVGKIANMYTIAELMSTAGSVVNI